MSFWKNEEEYKVKLVDFTERFIPHNFQVNLYLDRGRNTSGFREYERIWTGMDWQITEGYSDSNYFKVHNDVLPCPYSEVNVVGVIGLCRFPGAVDEVSLVVEKLENFKEGQ